MVDSMPNFQLVTWPRLFQKHCTTGTLFLWEGSRQISLGLLYQMWSSQL